ncbi:MAG: NYN domain-containing protein [Nanoarchaeota archaeon]
MSKSKHQRIGVFVDVQNLYYSAKDFYGKKVNFQAILKEATAGRSLIRAFAYVIKADMKEEAGFFDALRSFGYEVRSKDLQTFPGGMKKGDWDIGIAMDMIELAPRLDTLILVSGDGDFIPLVQHLRRAMGSRIELIAFRKSASQRLVEEVDDFIDLDKDPRKYLRVSRRPEPERKEQAPLASPGSARAPEAPPSPFVRQAFTPRHYPPEQPRRQQPPDLRKRSEPKHL